MSSVSDERLLPCPFCGGALIFKGALRGEVDWVEVASHPENGCHLEMFCFSLTDENIAAWNRRSTDGEAVLWVDADVLDRLPYGGDQVIKCRRKPAVGSYLLALYTHPTPIEPVAVTDEMVERACQAAGKNWDLWGSREGVAKRELMRTALTAALIVQPKQTEVDGNQPLLLNPLHIELLKRGAQGQFIWLRNRADLHTADLHTAGELCRAGFARMSEPSNIPGPPCFPGFEITKSGRAALIAALTPPVTP